MRQWLLSYDNSSPKGFLPTDTQSVLEPAEGGGGAGTSFTQVFET